MRRSGQTTRLVDRCIQEFFTNGFTFIYEGIGSDKYRVMNNEALGRFKRRMKSEHPASKFEVISWEFSGIKCFRVTKIELPSGIYAVDPLMIDEFGNLKLEESKYPGCVQNDPEKGKVFLISQDRDTLKSVGVYEDEEIVDSKGKLLCQYSNGICILSVKRKYKNINNTILDSTILLPKALLKILD